MGKIKVQVTPNKPQSLQVGVSNVKNAVQIEENPTHYYSTLAKQWAVKMDGKVQNEDYSSKYWAQDSKNQAEISQAAAETASNLVELLDKNYTNYTENLEELSSQTTSEITEIKLNSLTEIEQKRVSAIDNLNDTKINIQNEIYQAKTNAVTEIETVGNDIENATKKALQSIIENEELAVKNIQNEGATQIANIQQTGFYMKDGKLYYIDENGEEQEFKSGSNGGVSLPLLTPIFVDHVLSYEKSQGYGRCGEYIYATAIAGERYGYPDLIKDLIAEYNSGVATTVTQDTKSVACRKSASGHYFYDIANLADVDAIFDETGVAWMYGVDIENNRIMLPKINKYFGLVNSPDLVGTYGRPEVPNIKGTMTGYDSARGMTWNTARMSGPFSRTANSTGGSGPNSQSGTAYGIEFDASKVSPVYTDTDTLQIARANMLCYIVVGNTQQDTSWIDVVTDVNGAVKDVVDAGDRQVERINTAAQAYDNLTYRNVTNCLLEVPQRIKYELTDGILTIKSGSELLMPDGTHYVLEHDISTNTKVNTSYQLIAFHSPSAVPNGFSFVPISDSCSGDTDALAGKAYHLWFDTLNRQVKYYVANGALLASDCTLPFIIATNVNGTGITSVDNVFQSMGYVGSTVWVDKGVKGLIPSGRNEDGTCKNTLLEITTLKMYTSAETNNYTGFIMSDGTIGNTSIFRYDAERNIMYNSMTGEQVSTLFYSTYTRNSGTISNYQPYQTLKVGGGNNSPFALNYNAGIAITNGSTAPKAGMVYAINSATKTSSFLAVNGIQTGFAAGGSIVQDPTSLYGFVSQGDIITFSGCSTVILFPFKGV